jgi:predicted RNA-binding Zn-ribbon protein involved in translation (DUF1610 family)
VSALAVAPGVLRCVASEPTLDDLISGVCEVLAAAEAAACPVCGGAMRAAASRSGALHGSCTDCGSLLF